MFACETTPFAALCRLERARFYALGCVRTRRQNASTRSCAVGSLWSSPQSAASAANGFAQSAGGSGTTSGTECVARRRNVASTADLTRSVDGTRCGAIRLHCHSGAARSQVGTVAYAAGHAHHRSRQAADAQLNPLVAPPIASGAP